MRALLDARSEAQAVHGLEMRTELRFGNVARSWRRQLANPAIAFDPGRLGNQWAGERFSGLLSGELAMPPTESGLLATGSNILAGGTKLLTTGAQVLTGGRPQSSGPS